MKYNMGSKEQKINNENDTEESFEDLLNKTSFTPLYLNPGEQIEAEVIKITDEWVFIDTGGKSEGYISLNEFIDEERNITIKEGEIIKVYFLSSRNNERHFTSRLSMESSGKEFLKDAFNNGIPVQGIVDKEIKGGFEVKIAGNVRAFCPYSQMSINATDEGDPVGEELTFKISEYSGKGRNIIVSRRVILEEEREKIKLELKDTLKEGMTVSGTVASIRNFGAFIDVGGIEGLVPISEISWGQVEDIQSILSVGQKVDVMIMNLDWAKDKFSFSLKEVLPNPWDGIQNRYPEGSVHEGQVVRLAKFGAFVNLEPGVDGLVHISELGKGKRINHPREVLENKQKIKVKVNSLDEEKRRLSLSILGNEGEDEDRDDYRKKYLDNSKSSGSFGTLGDLLKAKLGDD
jgi:small subunit ribosomal protein S1